MKRFYSLVLSVLILSILPIGFVHAEDAASAMRRIGQDVSELNLGFGDYVLGRRLNDEQQKLARLHSIQKTVPGTIKFNDGDIFVIAQSDNFMVLGIYKLYKEASHQKVKTIVGDLMLRFNEPTTMAHDKLIYWAFNKKGRLDQDEYDSTKKTEDTKIIATVKFSSTSSVFPDPAPEEKHDKETEKDEMSDIYVMITSNPLSKIFLAQNK